MPMRHARAWLAGLLLGLCSWSWALTPEQAFKIADGDSDDRIAALNEAVGAGDAVLAAYLEAQARVDRAWHERQSWQRMSLLNTARSGYFSSDRSVREYATRIWQTPSVPVEMTCPI